MVHCVGEGVIHLAVFLNKRLKAIEGLASRAGNCGDKPAVVLRQTDTFLRLEGGSLFLC